MKKLLVIAAASVVLAAAAKAASSKAGGIDWQQRIDSLPDNAPPKWMFRNIAAIRENTDRILQLLEHRDAAGLVAEAKTSPIA